MSAHWLAQAINDQAMWYAGYMAELYKANKVAKRLNVPEGVTGFLSVASPGSARLSRIVLRAEGDQLGETARTLLPLVGTFKKSFDTNYGTMELTGVVDDVEIAITGRPPESCEVERVVEEIEVPTEEAHTEERVSYVMKGDCDPLLKPPEPEPEPELVPEETQSPTEEDVQHA